MLRLLRHEPRRAASVSDLCREEGPCWRFGMDDDEDPVLIFRGQSQHFTIYS